MMDFGDKGVFVVPVVMMNFGDRGVFVRIPFHPDTLCSGLSMRDVPAFTLVTAHNREMSRITCNMTRVRKDAFYMERV